MIKHWALSVLTCAYLTGGCNRVDNSFSISDPDRRVASAQLRLCGSVLQLRRKDDQLTISAPIRCEGSGDILVHLSDGAETSCPVGYITTGATQDFEYVIEEAQCR
jgi:hypothetical protein